MLAVPLTDYYEEVRRYLTCPEAVKDDLLFDVNRQVMDLNADLPDLDYDDLVEFLGEPEDLARQFMDSLGLDSSPNHQEEKLRPHFSPSHICYCSSCSTICHIHLPCLF